MLTGWYLYFWICCTSLWDLYLEVLEITELSSQSSTASLQPQQTHNTNEQTSTNPQKKKYNANTVNKESNFFNLIYFSWSIAQGKHSYNVLYFPGKFWVLSWFIFYCFIFFIFFTAKLLRKRNRHAWRFTFGYSNDYITFTLMRTHNTDLIIHLQIAAAHIKLYCTNTWYE